MRVKAARLAEHGQPLRVGEADLPEPGPQDVIVDIACAGVNPVDMYAAQGQVAADGPVPRTLGAEAAGTADGRPVMVRGYGIGTARDGLWAAAAVVPPGGFTGAAIEALQPHGRLVLFRTSAAPEGPVPLRSLHGKGITVLGYAGLLESDEVISAAIREALQALAGDRLTVPIDSAMPLAQVDEAFDRIRQRQVRGKIILDSRA